MLPKNNQINTIILIWSYNMVAIFLQLLEEKHNIGKCKNTGFKHKSWNIFPQRVQKKYKKICYIKIKKLQNQPNYVRGII